MYVRECAHCLYIYMYTSIYNAYPFNRMPGLAVVCARRNAEIHRQLLAITSEFLYRRLINIAE